MPQLTLFDDERISRKSDPETSKDAAQDIQSKLPKVQAELLAVFRRSASALTANEAAELVAKGVNGIASETARKRVHELERKMLIRSAGTRGCSVTGKRVTQYEAVR